MARIEKCMDVTGVTKTSHTATLRYKYKAGLLLGLHCRAESVDGGQSVTAGLWSTHFYVSECFKLSEPKQKPNQTNLANQGKG